MNIAFSPPPRSSVPLMPHRIGLFSPSLNCTVPCSVSLLMSVSPTSINPYKVTLLCASARIETAVSAVANATHVHNFFIRRLLFCISSHLSRRCASHCARFFNHPIYFALRTNVNMATTSHVAAVSMLPSREPGRSVNAIPVEHAQQRFIRHAQEQRIAARLEAVVVPARQREHVAGMPMEFAPRHSRHALTLDYRENPVGRAARTMPLRAGGEMQHDAIEGHKLRRPEFEAAHARRDLGRLEQARPVVGIGEPHGGTCV